MRITLSKEEEARLIDQFRKNRDNKTFGKLYKFYFDFVYNNAFRLLKNNDLAFDLSQDTFIKVIQKIGLLENNKHFKGWISTITRNLCFDYLKTNKRRRITEEYSFHIIEDTEFDKQLEERIVNMYQIIESLGAAEKELVIRKYRNSEKISEISQELDVKESAIKMRLKRVRKKIKEAS